MTSSVTPVSLPARLSRLPDLAFDLSWIWTPARDLFRRLDYGLWRKSGHNPVRMLKEITPEIIGRILEDPALLSRYDDAVARLDQARAGKDSWWQRHVEPDRSRVLAYFCAEFALHQSLPIYAGGLGVLAGDHCKEACDLGIPLVGVGFMYPQGYFRQRISAEGWQQEVYERLDWSNAPVSHARTIDDKPCLVLVPLGNRTVMVRVWEVRLGSVRLLLLDTDLEQNAPWDRELSARLYGGGHDTRLQQEVVLGLGGVLTLRALGLKPAAWHLNEGHAAFVVLQRLRDFLAAGQSWEEAIDDVKRTTIFTTHTPVPAGHDAFPFHMVEQQLANCWGSINGNASQFLELGTYDSGQGLQFNMTALAMRTAGVVNAVSKLHGEVTRNMFAPLWPGTSPEQRPVGSITNGVHVPSWVSRTMARLFEKHLGASWREFSDDPKAWLRVLDIPDEELWAARNELRAHLVKFARDRARARWSQELVAPSRILSAGVLLERTPLTIGFARRFTGYKRPDLVFRDPDRLARLVTALDRPVQLVFAGKAHPADEAGKNHLQNVLRHALNPKFGGRIAFVDDYDLHVAQMLVQGCDVWLNTPRRPLEASGTSGMKASMNGALHLSIADGWWAEGFSGSNGWIIGGQGDVDPANVDAADAESLYELLEREIVPTFYDRDDDGLPRRWLAMVKQSLLTITPRFSARRMFKEYVEKAYGPAFLAKQASQAQPL